MPFTRPVLGRACSLLLLSLLSLTNCTDPVDPEFRYQSGLIYIDAFASNATGASFAQVFESGESFGLQTNVFQRGAQVRFVRASDGMQVALTESEDRYLPPADFTVAQGEHWRLEVTLAEILPGTQVGILVARTAPRFALATTGSSAPMVAWC